MQVATEKVEQHTDRMSVAFHQPWLGHAEALAVARAVRQGVVAGNGPICREVEAQLCHLLGVRHALLMSSCTAALETAIAVLKIGEGEVILPSFAFPSVAATIVRAGAQPVFVDIERRYLGLDPHCVEQALTPRTRAIIHVEYGGFPGMLEDLQHLAFDRGIPLIEDAAHALGSRVRDRSLGGWGTVSCVSFHETKIATCGEGGAFLTNDDALASAASIYREYGTNRSAFFHGEVDHYEWVGSGSSHLLAEPLAGLLQVQLGKLSEGLERRRLIARGYQEGFAALAVDGILQLPAEGPEAQVNWHTFSMLVRDRETADRLIGALAQRGIDARRHFFPLHRSVYAKRCGYSNGHLPVTESVAGRLVRLPIYPTLARTRQAHVVRAVLNFFRAGPLPPQPGGPRPTGGGAAT